jgi:hypothetical protein
MDPTRYQNGGDLYAQIQAQFGTAAANQAAAAANAGDGGVQLRNVLSDLRTGASPGDFSGSTSTFSNFWTQITTDPLAAPLASANTAFQNSFFSFLKSPWVLLVIAAAIFAMAGGFKWLFRQLQGKFA